MRWMCRAFLRTRRLSWTVSGWTLTCSRLRCSWMNTLFSQPIHHTAGNIVLQHLVFRLFLCSKHGWYKHLFSVQQRSQSLITAPLFLEDFFFFVAPVLNIIVIEKCICYSNLNFRHFFFFLSGLVILSKCWMLKWFMNKQAGCSYTALKHSKACYFFILILF